MTRLTHLPRLVLPAYLLLGLVAVALTGCLDNPYLAQVRGLPPPHPYPLRGVLWVMAAMGLQAAAVLAILRPRSWRRSWGRALAATGLSAGFLLLGMLAAMHSPPHHTAYLLWLLGAVVALGGLAAGAAIAAWRGHGRGAHGHRRTR